MMRITVNGKDHQTAARTIAALLAELKIAPKGTAVALNGEVVPASQLEESRIPQDAKIEIVQAVQGG